MRLQLDSLDTFKVLSNWTIRLDHLIGRPPDRLDCTVDRTCGVWIADRKAHRFLICYRSHPQHTVNGWPSLKKPMVQSWFCLRVGSEACVPCSQRLI